MGAQVVLATLGSLGDLHPFIAIARALKQHGHAPVIATTPDFRANVTGEGIGFHPVGPSRSELLEDLKMDFGELGRRVVADALFVFDGGVFPYLGRMYDDLQPALEDSSVVLSSTLMYSARCAAERRGIAQLSVALQPMVFLSAHDPPVVGTAPWAAALLSKLGPAVTGVVQGLAKSILRRRARPLHAFRSELGLPPQKDPLFAGQFSPQGTLAAFSRVLASIQPDYPPRTVITGFPFYDGASREQPDLAPDLRSFLASGPPPLVFTLGSFAVEFPGPFYRASRDAARQLGRRAVLLIGPGAPDRADALRLPDVFVADYAPHSRLFPLAAAVIHHGGIGTTGQALRAGKPQLIVPILSDQFDNAARIVRLGAGRSLRFDRYAARTAGAEISALLAGPEYGRLAARAAEDVRAEDGAEASACAVDDLLQGRPVTWRHG